LNQRLIPIC